MRRSANEHHSIAELLDDPIAKLLMVSDGVNRCALQFALRQMARVRASAHVGEAGQ